MSVEQVIANSVNKGDGEQLSEAELFVQDFLSRELTEREVEITANLPLSDHELGVFLANPSVPWKVIEPYFEDVLGDRERRGVREAIILNPHTPERYRVILAV